MKPSRVGGVDPTRAALGGPDTLRKTFTQMGGLDAAVFVSGGVSSGNTVTRLEFMDLNGDRRPDSVAYNRASFFDDRTGQYISGDPLGMAANGSLRLTEVNFTRFGAGFGTAASALVGAISPSSTKLKAAVSILPSLEHNTGKTDELSEFLDVNGDGLPDHVRVVNGVPQVQINLGYTFGPELPATAWPLPASAVVLFAALLRGRRHQQPAGRVCRPGGAALRTARRSRLSSISTSMATVCRTGSRVYPTAQRFPST